MSNTAPIGSPQQPLTEMDLHFVMRALAKKQALTEHMVIAARENRWHLALSLIQKELGIEPPSRTRKIVEYVLHGLRRDVPDGEDAGSTLVEDLPMPWGDTTDVVVSWADSMEQLQKEVSSIRSCLDALGLFNTEGQHKLQEVHAEHLNLGVGEVLIHLDRDKHEFSATGNLQVGRLLSLLGHIVPGLGKTAVGGTVNLRLPYKDSREKFIAALMALQWQSNGALATCSDLQNLRDEWKNPDVDAAYLQAQYEKTVLPARNFLKTALAAVDREMCRAFSVHPVGERYALSYRLILRSLEAGHYEDAITGLSHVQYPGPKIRQAMGENFYLFAANVIMQAQIAGFERDLERVLQDRFGQTLRRDTVAQAQAPSSPSASEPTPPASAPRIHRPRPR